MPFKRIVGVLTVRDGQLVKSYGYSQTRPAGGLVTALRNLDRWGADEIVVLDISRRAGLDAALLAEIKSARVTTPLAYGGGIRSAEDVHRLMEAGCDRFVIEHALFSSPELVHRLAELVGRQALIGSLPMLTGEHAPAVWRPETTLDWSDWRERVRLLPVSEYLVTAANAEGRAGSFPTELPALFDGWPAGSVIWFGGLDVVAAKVCVSLPQTVGVAWGNPLHEREIALPILRRRLGRQHVRAVRLS